MGAQPVEGAGPARRRRGGARTKVVVGVLLVLSVLYLVRLADWGVRLLGSGEVVGVLLGVGVIIVPLLVGWAIVREVLFGAASQRLADELAATGGLPVDDLRRRPSGRVVREDAERLFTRYRAEVEEDDNDWARWYRLSLAYDASGDRRRARAAARHAISLHP
ncbi:hypothetical protein [Pseudokineococcus sp. 1T1Z-3]|uniref:hypothetical protein n=1 Tax=Pseudokineococcus sp. 1T1Z-3 TaxID=3132745 RepID=UPI0030A5B8E1